LTSATIQGENASPQMKRPARVMNWNVRVRADVDAGNTEANPKNVTGISEAVAKAARARISDRVGSARQRSREGGEPAVHGSVRRAGPDQDGERDLQRRHHEEAENGRHGWLQASVA
jgi:hypothetical protein